MLKPVCSSACIDLCSKRFFAKGPTKKWIIRQQKDPYVHKAKEENFRCRSAFKLVEINEKFHILRPGMNVLDIGASPGSWAQVTLPLINADGRLGPMGQGGYIGVDLLPCESMDGATFIQGDINNPKTMSAIKKIKGNQQFQAIISDMAPNKSGIKTMDCIKMVYMYESIWKHIMDHDLLADRGSFIGKIWMGVETKLFAESLVSRFKTIYLSYKPPASRVDSAEAYIVGMGYRSSLMNIKGGYPRRTNSAA